MHEQKKTFIYLANLAFTVRLQSLLIYFIFLSNALSYILGLKFQ